MASRPSPETARAGSCEGRDVPHSEPWHKWPVSLDGPTWHEVDQERKRRARRNATLQAFLREQNNNTYCGKAS